MNHEEWTERADIYALGALDGEELTQFEAHLSAGCPECQRHLRDNRAALTSMVRSLTPSTPAPVLRARVLGQIDREVTAVTVSKPWLPRVSWGFGAGALAAAILLLISGFLIVTRRQLAQHEAQIAALQSDLAKREEVIAFLTNPQVRAVSLAGLPASPNARGLLLWNPANRTGVFLATGLSNIPVRTIYELWAISGNEPVPAGLFTLDAQGRALLTLPQLPEGKAFDKFAVTLEPAGGVPKPTGPMHLLGSL
jgi:anti-sigma-K factor RskA